MKRKSLSNKARAALFLKHGGVCHLCGIKIDRKGWEVEHVIPLSHGGEDTEENMRPAHASCHAEKTKGDVKNLFKAIRRQQKHIGAFRSRNPLPGGRLSPWRKKISGEVVPR